MLVLNKLHKYIVKTKNANYSSITNYIPHACNVYHYMINNLYRGLCKTHIYGNYQVDVYTRFRYKPNKFVIMQIKKDWLTIYIEIDVLKLVFERHGSRVGNPISMDYNGDDFHIYYDFRTNQKKTVYFKDFNLTCCNYYEQLII